MRAPSKIPAAYPSWLLTTARAIRVLLLTAIVAFCLLLLAVRFVAFPRLESNRDGLTQLLERQIGQPVEIDGLATGWDGWNPRVELKGVRILEPGGGAPAMVLPGLRLTVAWTSVVFFDLRFKELTIDQPELSVRRDAAGKLHVAGLTIDPAEGNDDQRLADWLLRQSRIVVHDAAIIWRDELRAAAPLSLAHVEFRLENRFGHHRFGLTGEPPAALASPLDLRGDVTGASLADWSGAGGRFYARLDYADVAAWRSWLPLPVPIKSGTGAVRLWFEFGHGQARELVADLVLADVEARLGDDLPELTLDRLEGRVGWRVDDQQREFFARQLAFAGRDGLRLDPTDLKLTLRGAAETMNDGRLEFDHLELAPLRRVAAALPLTAHLRDELARVAPRGTMEQGKLEWIGEATAPKSFNAAAQLSDVGFAAQDSHPGVSGLSGSLEATHLGGSLKVQSRALTLELPRVFAEPLAFDHLQGQLHWRRQHEGTTVAVDKLIFDNADVSGNASGEYGTSAEGPGTINATAQLTRVDARQAYRYVPLASAPAIRDRLRTLLVAGSASDVRVKLVGNLANFPFADGKAGQFQVSVKGQGATLDYANGWPRLSGVDAELRFDGARMTIDAHHARVFSTELSRLKADIADLRLANPVLRVDGEAPGPIADALRFVAESPVAGWIDHFTDRAEADGSGTVSFRLELPLGRPEANQVVGEYNFANNHIKLAGDVPGLSQVNGKLMFSNHEVRASPLTAEVVGGPARLNIASADGRVRVDAQGTANLGLLRSAYASQPLLNRVSGTTDWQLAMQVANEATTWTLDSTLRGAAVDLPRPMAKAAADAVPFRIQRQVTDPDHDALAIRYGALGRLSLHRRLTPAGAVTEDALLALGTTGGDADRRGLWVRGEVATLDLDGWLAVKRQLDSGRDSLPLTGVDITVGAMEVFGRQLSDLRIGASRGGDDWQIDLRGRELYGTARWQGPAPGRLNGRIVARLQRFTAPPSAPPSMTAIPTVEGAPPAANPWPSVDIVAESFRLKNRDLGKLELIAQPSESDWRIESLKLSSDDGSLVASGWWRGAGRAPRTQLDTDLEVRDAGKYLARFGMPDAVRGGQTHIHGQLEWSGSPQEFDYPTLNGMFRVETGSGQFVKLDPGLGKLLGVLSLQALKRRFTFDFQDLFGEGFAFDEITGDVRIQDGVMKCDNLKIVGPSARVSIAGETNIADETQKLRVRVQPTLSGTVSVGAAALLLANPILGAAVGAGTLLAQTALKDPIEQMFAYEYAVSGSWSDPIVERTGRPATAAVPAQTTKQ
ncbi:MAG TPA: YhdP family protein [Casimicrobiaceae bacterium]|nr:YhdP family protein [Casimicrobiaceae bacterium]